MVRELWAPPRLKLNPKRDSVVSLVVMISARFTCIALASPRIDFVSFELPETTQLPGRHGLLADPPGDQIPLDAGIVSDFICQKPARFHHLSPGQLVSLFVPISWVYQSRIEDWRFYHALLEQIITEHMAFLLKPEP
ncbi:MAG: hypothetical protein QM270_05860 [Bacillota bacterium]|nr:hypothetical protein [Bacillota bacterium]